MLEGMLKPVKRDLKGVTDFDSKAVKRLMAFVYTLKKSPLERKLVCNSTSCSSVRINQISLKIGQLKATSPHTISYHPLAGPNPI